MTRLLLLTCVALLSSCAAVTTPIKVIGKAATTTIGLAGKAAGAGIDAISPGSNAKSEEE